MIGGLVRRQAFLDDRAQLGPERPVVGHRVALELVERRVDLLHQLLADELDLAVLLQDLARHVERQVVGVDDAADEAEVLRHQLLALVHDEDALHVQLQAPLHLGVVEIERGPGRDVEQRVGLERALHPHRDRPQRIGPVVRDVAVEVLVLGLGDLGLGPVPDRLHRVEGGVLDLADRDLRLVLTVRVSVVAIVRADRPLHLDRVADEVGVALDDAGDDAVAGVVVHAVLVVGRLEVQRHRGPGLGPLAVADQVGAVAGRLPARRRLGAEPAGHQHDLVGDHERRVEADAELPDQPGRGLGVALLLSLAQRGHELLGARARDGADVLDHVVAGHADAVVGDRQGAGDRVDVEPEVELTGLGQLALRQLLEPALVERVGAVRDQLAEEDVLVGVERVDHEVEQLLDLGLEVVTFEGLAHGDRTLA